MKIINPSTKKPVVSESTEEKSFSSKTTVSSRGFASIDQEMERDIALSFFDPLKKSLRSQKGFFFVK